MANYPSSVTDSEWEIFETLLSPIPNSLCGRPQENSRRSIFDGIWYVIRKLVITTSGSGQSLDTGNKSITRSETYSGRFAGQHPHSKSDDCGRARPRWREMITQRVNRGAWVADVDLGGRWLCRKTDRVCYRDTTPPTREPWDRAKAMDCRTHIQMVDSVKVASSRL